MCNGLLSFGLWATAFTALAQTPTPRTFTTNNVTYTVTYRLINPEVGSTPAIAGAQTHYDCDATAYVGTNKLGTVRSQWTMNGCWEDNPGYIVQRVLDQIKPQPQEKPIMPEAIELSSEERAILRANLYTKIGNIAKRIASIMSEANTSSLNVVAETTNEIQIIERHLKRLRELAP